MIIRTAQFLVAGAAMAALCNTGAWAQNHPPPFKDSRPASALEALPSTIISNGVLTAKVFAPESGFSTGTRFDHAGVVTHVTYKGQDYNRFWFSAVSTDVHDYTYETDGSVVAHPCCAASGPVEEYDDIGFDDAKMGGSFLKIGVGVLKRTTEKYDHVLNYPIINEGKRTTKATKGAVTFTQDISGDPSGYGYHYEKVVKLTPGKPQMTILHVLKNTGTKPIVTAVYAHNFTSLSPGNADIMVTAPFDLVAGKPFAPGAAEVRGKTFRYLRPVTGHDSVTAPFTGFGGSASDYDFKVENAKTGYGLRIRADQPLAKINFWSVATTFSWEPYVAISLKPGETKRWTYTYDYFAKGEM